MSVHPIRRAMDLIVGPEVVAQAPRRPRYVAEGRNVVTVSSGRVQSPQTARTAAHELLEACFSTRDEGLAETDTLALTDLIRAIRQAERNDPTPPAAIARAA